MLFMMQLIINMKINKIMFFFFLGFIIDDDGMSVGPYHDHHHYHQSNSHRFVRAESLKSDNSLEEHAERKLYRDSHYKISNPHLLSNNRDVNGQYRIVEIDPDAIQVIGDVDLQNLPDSVSREILKNSREIVYEEDSHHDYVKEENFHKIANSKRGYSRYPLIDEEKKSLSGSRRNLSNRNFTIIDDDKRSLNGSKRNLNGSKKYLLLPLEKPDIWNDSSKNNLSKENLICTRRNTGSKERLNSIKRGTNCTKPTKEHYDIRTKSKLYQPVNVDIEFEKHKKYLNISDITKNHGATISSPSSPNDVVVTINSESVVTPESGFAESQHSGSSPEYFRKELSLPGNSIIQRNRRSYEHAQLQDVNQIIQRNNSGCSSSDSDAPITDNNSVDIVQKQLLNNKKQTVSHTSV